MKIDLCKLFNVKEGEEFILETKDGWFNDLKYKIENNIIKVATIEYSDYSQSSFNLNEFVYIEKIIKLPKKKKFSQDTLNFFKCIDKKYKWIAKDKSGDIFGFEEKPKKDKYVWLCEEYDYCLDNTCCIDGLNQSLFNEILWEDDEPIYIDDYVERKDNIR